MKQERLVALLGRPLTPVEVTNLKPYLKIAIETLETMLCASINKVTETRTFDSREGYRTVFTGYFTDLEEVKIDGEVIEPSDYSTRQWDKRTAKWYNSIVFDRKRGKCEIEVTADWGFNKCTPTDLESLIAKLFAQVSAKNTTNSNVASKQVEDFRITFRTDATLDEQFAEDNALVLNKYSLCDIGMVRSGEVCNDGRIPGFY